MLEYPFGLRVATGSEEVYPLKRLTLTLLCAIAQTMLPVIAASPLDQQSALAPQATASSKWVPGQPVIERIHGQIQGFQDYVFDSALTVDLGSKIKSSLGHFFYKRNKRFRVECVSAGVNNGAIVVRSDDGIIMAEGGGMLKFMKMNLQPDSRLLILANGYNVLDSDVQSLLNILQSRMVGCQALVTAEVIKDPKTGAPWKVVEIRKGPVLTDRIIVNAGDFIPVEWDLYKDGSLFSIARFDKFKANIGLNDSLFSL